MDIYEISKLYDLYSELEENLQKASVPTCLTIVCMLIDYCSARYGSSSMELIKMLTPMIKEVNDVYGGYNPGM